MRVEFRKAAICATLAAAAGGAMVSPALFPQAFANEPQHQLVRRARDIFPPPFDPSKLRKYDIEIAETVSTEPLRTQYVRKIAGGRPSTVTIMTTSSGTYSSDGIVSPYVLYPGIDVTTKGSEPHVRTWFSNSRWGSSTSIVVSAGSFTYYNWNFTPARRHR